MRTPAQTTAIVLIGAAAGAVVAEAVVLAEPARRYWRNRFPGSLSLPSGYIIRRYVDERYRAIIVAPLAGAAVGAGLAWALQRRSRSR